MKILGISGLHGAVAFKRTVFPDLEEREYRIAQGFDSAAALIIDGELVAAAEEERFTRNKHTGDFPINAIQFCLKEAAISLGEVDELAHGFDFTPYRALYQCDPLSSSIYQQVYSREALNAQVQRNLPELPEAKIRQVGHHLAHAASAAYTSGWDECLVVVNDAMGEIESTSVYDFHDARLEKICTIGANDSIGVLYSLVTLHLGFDFNSDEYKIMGLAPYGNPDRYRDFFERAVHLSEDGTIRIPILKLNGTRSQRETYSGTRSYLAKHLIPARMPHEPITSTHEDVAASLQECLENAVLHICRHAAQRTGLRRIALAGGVSLNCTANGALMRSGIFDEVYVQPVAGDAGTALGAGLYRASIAGEITGLRMPIPFLGPRFNDAEIEIALRRFEDQIRWHRFVSLQCACKCAAALIAAGRVVAWFRGRMEFGPRALGNRSIFADPGRAEMRDRINSIVKKRESFRPFAPACTMEEASLFFDIPRQQHHPYMISVGNVLPHMRGLLPAVTHVNGSARLQTVSANDNPDLHALLVAVGTTTGRQMLLNTSFNIKGQPIVNTPEEAITTFLGTGIECLFLENFHVVRSAA